MNRTILFGITTFFALVGVSLLGGEKQALAGHGCYGCYGYPVRYAYRGCYGGCYGGYYGGGYYGGYYGYRGYRAPVRRVLFGPRTYGYYRPPVGYGWVGRYGGWDCCGGRVVTRRSVVPAPEASPAPPVPTLAPVPDEASVSRDAMLYVRVAPDVQVFVNDRATSTLGNLRHYVSKGLEPGKQYRYELRAEAVRHGEKVSQTKVVMIEAGGSVSLAFDLGDARVAQAPAR